MNTAKRTSEIEDSHIIAFARWLKSSDGQKERELQQERAKVDATTIESISQVELQKLKEPFIIKP